MSNINNNVTTCEKCKGSGFLSYRQELGRGIQIKCPNCRGRGLTELPQTFRREKNYTRFNSYEDT